MEWVRERERDRRKRDSREIRLDLEIDRSE